MLLPRDNVHCTQRGRREWHAAWQRFRNQHFAFSFLADFIKPNAVVRAPRQNQACSQVITIGGKDIRRG